MGGGRRGEAWQRQQGGEGVSFSISQCSRIGRRKPQAAVTPRWRQDAEIEGHKEVKEEQTELLPPSGLSGHEGMKEGGR